MMPRATEWGTTAEEQEQGETINQRIAQEVPDPDSAYGAPENEGGRGPAGAARRGADPDAIEADDDWLGDDAAADEAGRLVSDDAGERSGLRRPGLGYRRRRGRRRRQPGGVGDAHRSR